MIKSITVSLFILALLFSAGPATAKTFYLKDGAAIEYRNVWKQSGLIYLLVNRDTLVTFLPEEVDQARTLKAAGLKKFPSRPMKKSKKPVSTSAKRTKAAAVPLPVMKPAQAEEGSAVFGESRASATGASAESNVPAEATAKGKYSNLVQVMNCPRDSGSYGDFKDYGWWGGGPWCGQTGKAGYWVWVAPDWYVWSVKN